MVPQSLAPLFRKLSGFAPLRPEEIAAVAKAFGRPTVYRPKADLPLRRGGGNRAFLIEEGWGYTYKLLKDGSRQIIDIGVAGDILAMRSLLLQSSDVAAAMATAGVVRELAWSSFESVVVSAPRAAAALLWASSVDEALVAERLVDVGRRNAPQRVAHFMLELGTRLFSVGLANGQTYKCPLSQSLIADALGLTPIHLNRTLRQLRLANLLVAKDGLVTILNRTALESLCGYDATYMGQAEPRLIAAE
jgi:CRP-like cAMP-binding protein